MSRPVRNFRSDNVTGVAPRIMAATDAGSVGENLSGLRGFQAVRAGPAIHLDDALPLDQSGGALGVAITGRLTGPGGEFRGVAIMQVGLPVVEDFVTRTITGLQAIRGTSARVEYHLLNRDGMLIADSLLRQEGAFNFRKMGVRSAELAGTGPSGFVLEQHQRREVEVITGFARMKGTAAFENLGWSVLVRMDRDDVLAPVRLIVGRLAGVGVLALLPLIGFLVWNVRRLGHERAAATSEAARATQAEIRFQTLLEAAPDAFVISDADGRITLVNGSAERLFGYTRDELLGKPIEVLLPERYRQGHVAKRAYYMAVRRFRPLASGSVLLALDKQGTEIPVEIGLSPVELPEGSVIIASIRDVREKKALEAARGRLAQELQLLLDSTGDGIYGIDTRGCCTFMNKAAAAMLGYAPEDLLGKDLHRVIHHSHPDGTYYAVEHCPIQQTCRQGTSARSETEVLWQRDGSAFPVSYSVHPIRHEGAIQGAVVTFRDITERKQVEAALLQAKAAAEEASVVKSQFVTNMGHELRTPLNGVLGGVAQLLETTLTSDQHECAELIRSSGEHLLEIISDVMDFSRLQTGDLTLESVPFGLRLLVDEVVGNFARRAEAKNLQLSCLVHADVPSLVCGDPGRLRQVLVNLVGNGVKFTEQGEVVVRVRVAGCDRSSSGAEVRNNGTLPRSIQFEVTDMGIGVPPETQARIFESFMQADGSLTRKFGGTGLGLTLSKQLIELMGGRIEFASQPGRGTTVAFTLPVREPVASVPERKLPEDLKGLKVLIVSPHASHRQVLDHYCTSWGMHCLNAEDQRQALEYLFAERARGTPCDLAILDVRLQGLDGLKLARRIKSEPVLAATRLILMASAGCRGDGPDARQAGIEGYISRPVSYEELYEVLLMVVGQPKAADAHGALAPLVTLHTVTEASKTSQARVLVVEDDVAHLKEVASALERKGYSVDVACSGFEAVEAVLRTSYDVILLDCRMPEMDGFEATRQVREHEAAAGLRTEGSRWGAPSPSSALRRVPIIAMTANTLEGDRNLCLAAGMDDCVSKPIRVDDLDILLRRLIYPQGACPLTLMARSRPALA